MDFNLYDNPNPPGAGPFSAPDTGIMKAAGEGIIRGGVKAAKYGAMVGSVFFPSETVPRDQDPDRIVPRKEDFFRFIDNRLDPTEKYWSPDPSTLSTAGRIVSGLSELPLQVVGGAPGMAGIATANTGIEQLDQGVDQQTASTVSAVMGAGMGALSAIPEGGTLLKKLLIGATSMPAANAATDLAAQKMLQSQGYTEQAKQFDPWDPTSRTVDTALGMIFGGLAHYGKVKERMPTDARDAIDTVETKRQADRLNPFPSGSPKADAHPQALDAAIQAVNEGRPVDVADGVLAPQNLPETTAAYTADRFRSEVKDVFGLSDEHADAALALVAARAKAQGEDLDSYIGQRIAGVEQGTDSAYSRLYQTAEKTDTPQFKAWFGGSKIVDTDGQPQMVYHGTNANFTQFAPGERGMFFSASKDVASNYTEYKRSPQSSHDGVVMPVYLAMKDPVTLQFGTGHSIAAAVAEAKANGNDGVIIKGYPDTYRGNDSIADMYIVFDPKQVKSAMGNRGTYDPADANILHQGRPIVQPFYSKVLTEVENLKQEKWNGDQLLATLRKTPGVKGDEIAWTGLDDFLAGKQSVTRQEVRDFLDQNQVRVQEVVKQDNYTDAEYNRMMELTHKVQRTPSEQAEFEQWADRIKREKPKYGLYVLPGGENYREMLLTLPDKGFGDNYYNRHFEEPNVLAHVRFNERTGADGAKILHVEEMQSDWHQEGKAKGYGPNIPESPFAKTWPELAMKRMLRYAAEHGFDRLTWTTGEQQAARYDISKQVDAVRYRPIDENSYRVNLYKDGRDVATHQIAAKDLPDAVGKELAEKIKAGTGKSVDVRQMEYKELSGVDLKIGGKGMKDFYDRILPTIAKDLGKKFGARVEDTQADGHTVHSVEITSAMKDALLYEGQPLFQGEKGAVSFLADGRAVIHALESPDFSTLVHELGHVFRRDLSQTEQRTFDQWLHSQVPGAKWGAAQEETFARAFERYLAEGRAPTEELQGVFDKFKNWLTEIYHRITGTALDVKMNDNVRAAFDRMLGGERARKAAEMDPFLDHTTGEIAAAREDLARELREWWGDDEPVNGEQGTVNGKNLEPRTSLGPQGPNLEPEPPARLAGPLGDNLDPANTFSRDPANPPQVVRDFMEAEARHLEEAEHGKVWVDGYEKSATWSAAPEWFLGRNREHPTQPVSRESVVNALRKAADGKYDDLTAGQKDMVLAAVDAISRQIHDISREIDGMELKVGDAFTDSHLQRRVVTGERDGRLILDSGEAIPLDRPFRIVGDVDTSGRPLEAVDPHDFAVETILRERGDFDIYDETGKLRSAREVVDEAKDGLAVARQQKHLFDRAAVCLNLG
ncbi:MAG TPA: hypothetical protein VI298_08720 [Geobacteraceae bacterium]